MFTEYRYQKKVLDAKKKEVESSSSAGTVASVQITVSKPAFSRRPAQTTRDYFQYAESGKKLDTKQEEEQSVTQDKLKDSHDK